MTCGRPIRNRGILCTSGEGVGRRLERVAHLFNPIRFAVYPRFAIACHHGWWSTYQRTVLQTPVSKFSSARHPSSRSSLEASIA